MEKFLTKEGIHFWGTDNHPIELWSNSVISQKLNDLHNNPVEEGLVFRAEQYIYIIAVEPCRNSDIIA
ncbi:MAG: hypothetical protein KBA43_00255 [Paludibacteraceae bacterium]|nr:hypothetical protein [Paludibacteraceae bacterium]